MFTAPSISKKIQRTKTYDDIPSDGYGDAG